MRKADPSKLEVIIYDGEGVVDVAPDRRHLRGKGAPEIGHARPLSKSAMAPIWCASQGPELPGLGQVRGGGTFDVSGQSRMAVGEVMGGDLSVEISGQSQVTIHDGQVTSLKADVSGQSMLTANISAHEATLEVSGTSKISVSEVTGRVDEDVTGMARVTVARRPYSGAKPGGG